MDAAATPECSTGFATATTFCHATSWNAFIVSSSLADAVAIDQDVPRTAEDLVVPVRRRIEDEPRVLYASHVAKVILSGTLL